MTPAITAGTSAAASAVPSAGWAPPAVNHVELVYRPGERALALRVLDALGCSTMDSGGIWARALVDPRRADLAGDSNNVLYVSEVPPEQWALEERLGEAMGSGALREAREAFGERLRHEPQRSAHFGIRLPDRTAFDARLESVRRAALQPELRGRLGVAGVFFPGDHGAVSPGLAQAFVWTDVVAAGLLVFGQHVELQLAVA